MIYSGVKLCYYKRKDARINSASGCEGTLQACFRGRRMIQFTVNGVVRHFGGDPEMPLLWYLRETLQLTGTKISCGEGLCGTCTVHVNGQARRSCITSVGQVAGADIVTIEGLSEHGEHPVQRAWIQVNVPQCGYCQGGQIMQAV